MTAQSADRALTRGRISEPTFSLKSGEVVYKGALIAFELGTAYVVEATGASDELVIGTAIEAVDATSAAKPIAVRLEREVNTVFFKNGSSIATANQGQLCYVTDDQTVSLTPNASGACLAGRIWSVDATTGVEVELIAGLTPGGATLAQAALPAHVSNDVILTAALAVPGSIFDIATTAANSTVTLPATGVAEGTVLTFVADGTKNGHTVQYRDATGPANLTTALTASKRHLVIATYLNGIWNANAYVSP
jgi:hypothetical protein